MCSVVLKMKSPDSKSCALLKGHEKEDVEIRNFALFLLGFPV
jgi:hypothetical protein